MPHADRIDILGCPFDCISLEDTVAAMHAAVVERRRLQIVPGSVDFVMKARRDPVFAGLLGAAELVIADGNFIVWAAQLLGTPLRGRVSGTELVWRAAEVSQQTGCKVAMIGGDGDVATRAAQRMSERYPGAQLHALPTPFPLGDDQSRALAEQIHQLGAGIVLVALGAPRQERWVMNYLEACNASVGIGIGSAFDIISGDRPRAPAWMQDLSLEWLWRMILEPRRLGRRYLIEDMPFLHLLAREAVRRALRSRS